MGTLVECKSRYGLGWRGCRGHTGAEAVLDAFTRHFRHLPACVRKTLTYDQGKEMARHEELARRMHIQVFFIPTAHGNDPAMKTPMA